MKELTLQIKPVGNYCNLNCTYCYANPFKENKFHILELELLDEIVKQAFEITDNLIISWHGGEPMMAGLKFYQNYMKIVNKYKKNNQKVVNMIQTNATLITEEFAEFFKDNNFIVSVSLDGDEKSHNKNRLINKSLGSFNLVMRGIEILRKNNINPPIIATVSQNTYDDCLKNFQFFVNNGFKEIKFSPVFDSTSDNFSISDDLWSNYLIKIFNKWIEMKNPEVKIREIDEILMWYAGTVNSLCSNRGMCSKWISIDDKGNFYPCEYLRSTHSYGNINTIRLIDIFKSKPYKDFVKKINYIPDKCQKCKLFNICHNGCPATRINNDRLTHNGIYVYCGQRRRLFDIIDEIIK